jgi:DUF4097 and DUF4098 domain-containing protein YvlB
LKIPALMKSLLGVLPLIVLLTGCEIGDGGWGENDSFKAEFHQSYPLKAGGKVSVDNFNGRVELMGWEKDEVEIHATRYARTQEQLDRVKIDVAASADAVRIRTSRPEGAPWNGNGGVRYVLRVPKRVDLERIASSNGSISVADAVGPANLRSSNGSIRASMVEGAVRAETTNGKVEMTGVAGNVVAETTNGGIEITAARLDGNGIRCETTNGGITLRMPAASKATLRARTSNGGITSEFEVASTRVEKHRLEGSIQGGGPLVELSTTNGGIRILRN